MKTTLDSRFRGGVFLAVFAGVALFLPQGVSSGLRGMFLTVTLPLAVAGSALGDAAGRMIGPVARSWGGLDRENRRLREEISRLQGIRARDENRIRFLTSKLDGLSRFQSRFPGGGAVAADVVTKALVLGRDSTSFRYSFEIDRGTRHGVGAGNLAVWGEHLVGKVAESGYLASRVMAIDDPACRVRVKVVSSREEGILEGIGGGRCRIKYLPRDFQAANGDMVVTSGSGGDCPEGIALGKIVDFERFGAAVPRPVVELDYRGMDVDSVAVIRARRPPMDLHDSSEEE
ncbi:MAG: rod shape-determining protein MreC [Planctomycetota bacterium]